MTTYFDKTGIALAIGQALRVRTCVGPYGQMQTVEGRIVALFENPAGVTLTLSATAYRMCSGRRQYSPVGADFYVTLPGAWAPRSKDFHCYQRFEDIEHAHESWAEVIG